MMSNHAHCDFFLKQLIELSNEVQKLYAQNNLRTGDLHWARDRLDGIMQKYVEGLAERREKKLEYERYKDEVLMTGTPNDNF